MIKDRRKFLLCLLCLLCIAAGIYMFPFPCSIANREVISVTASIDYDPTPVEFTDPAAITDFADAFSTLFAHFRPSAFVPAGGMGYNITFQYADGSKDRYRIFVPRIWKNETGIPLEISDEAWQNIQDAMYTWYFHGLDWVQWIESRTAQPPNE